MMNNSDYTLETHMQNLGLIQDFNDLLVKLKLCFNGDGMHITDDEAHIICLVIAHDRGLVRAFEEYYSKISTYTKPIG